MCRLTRNKSKTVSKYFLCICVSVFVSMNALAEKNVLVIGKVTVSERQKHFNSMKPMVDYVVDQLADYGVSKGEVFFASNNQEMIYALLTGKVDWVTESAFSALVLSDKAGAEIALRRWRSGVSEYHSIMLVKKDADIFSINDLKGKRIAFEDPGSTSAYFLPYIELLKNGVVPVFLHRGEKLVSSNEHSAGYVFSNSEFGMISDLIDNQVDAIAYSDLDYDELSPAIKSSLKIIHRSDAYPRGLELFSHKLDKEIAHRITDVLLNMANKPETEIVLEKYFNTDKFDLFSESESVSHARKLLRSGVIPVRLVP